MVASPDGDGAGASCGRPGWAGAEVVALNLVKSGDRVRVHYTARRQDGSIFHSSRPDSPLEFLAGSGELIEAVTSAVVGMKVGDSDTIVVPPERGYGPIKPGLEQRVPRRAVPADASIGDAVEVTIGNGKVVLWLRELAVDHATLDGNHPLAGQTLEVDIELLAVDEVSDGARRG